MLLGMPWAWVLSDGTYALVAAGGVEAATLAGLAGWHVRTQPGVRLAGLVAALAGEPRQRSKGHTRAGNSEEGVCAATAKPEPLNSVHAR